MSARLQPWLLSELESDSNWSGEGARRRVVAVNGMSGPVGA